jgi:hypothetical protein
MAADKINITTEASTTKVLPGKTGFLLFMEYFKKEKRMELRLEKLNQ